MARIANFCEIAGFMQLICTRVYELCKNTYKYCIYVTVLQLHTTTTVHSLLCKIYNYSVYCG